MVLLLIDESSGPLGLFLKIAGYLPQKKIDVFDFDQSCLTVRFI